jgi:hypothetical protein
MYEVLADEGVNFIGHGIASLTDDLNKTTAIMFLQHLPANAFVLRQ